MKHLILSILLLIVILALLGLFLYFRPVVFSGAGKVLVAAPNGRGEACSLFRPCTLLAAQQQARQAQTNGDILVYLRGGTYLLSETWQLGPQDSGKDGRWTIYRAYPGETPVLSGGAVVLGWEKDENEVVSAAWDGPAFRQLYINGRRATPARTPNRENDSDMGPYLRPLAWDLEERRIAVPAADVQDLPLDGQVEMVVQSHWHHNRLRVASLETQGEQAWVGFREPERSEPAFGHIASLDPQGNPQAQESYYWENALAFLDSPGEWYLDTADGRVYYWPLAGEDVTQVEAIVPVLETLVSIFGDQAERVQRLRLSGLTFAYSTWLQPNETGYVTWQAAIQASSGAGGLFPGMVTITQAEQVEITGCTFQHAGAHALRTSGPTHELAIVGNLLEDISANGIVLDGQANPAGGSVNDRIAHNTIHRVGRDYSEAVGIWASFPHGLVIEHNELYDLPYTAISMGWRWDSTPTAAGENVIRRNHIHHVLQKHDDGGAIYTLGRQPGSLIAENYIHDLTRSPFAGDYPVKGIYLDEGSVEFTVSRNLVELSLDDALNLHKTGDPIYYDRPLLLDVSQPERQEIIRQAGPQDEYKR